MIFIAAISHNWKVEGQNGKERALSLIEAACSSGADVIEFTLFDRLYRDENRQEIVGPYILPEEWLKELADRTREGGRQFALNLFDPIGLPITPDYYSVDSYNITMRPLLESIGNKDKPIFLSTGSATYQEIDNAIEILRPGEEAPDDLFLFHFANGTSLEDLNLRRILDLGMEFFPLRTGYEASVVSPWLVASTALFDTQFIKVLFDLEDQKGVHSGISEGDTNRSYTPSKFRELVVATQAFERARECGCSMPYPDLVMRSTHRRDPEDWLRPSRVEDEEII
jgi:sialic acid synthase SpsE